MPRFPSTIWQELDNARRGENAGWSAFVARYGPAVHSFLRGRGLSDSDAEDVTQDVFFHFVKSNLLASADPGSGRFRSLVLAVACNLLRHRWRDEKAEKRGGGRRTMSLEGIDMAAPTGEDEADFDREWVARMVGSVMEELRGERPAHHRALVLVLGGRSQPEIAAELRQSVAQVNNHVHRARAWVRTRIRSLVRESCSIPEAYEAETRHLDRYIDLDEREST